MKTKHNVLEFSMLCFVLINSVILNLFFCVCGSCEPFLCVDLVSLFCVWIL